TVYNAEGVRKAKKLGFSRVVLAREMTLEEIREITGENLLDIEVFAHGALCICYSGQCQMSREIGGRSGNRGECAQPCRLPYSVYRENNGSQASLGQKGLMQEVSCPAYALSPKDLCTIEQLGQLSEAGVASLKIEGRMKTPEYVAVATGIYRKYLDIYARHGQYKVDSADLQDLNQIFNRGGFTEGYLFGNPKNDLMSGDLSKHQGIYIGKVVKSTNVIRTGDRQRGLVTIQLDQDLSVGDGIEIRNKELSGNLVTFMKRMDKKADSVKKGELVTVGYIDGMMSPGDKVYKITDKALMLRARASYEGKSGSAEKSLRKMGVSFHFSAGLDRPVSLKATDEEGSSVVKELADRAERALTKAITGEIVTAQLSKTGGTPFKLIECTAEIEEGISVPLSKINELRRSALEELEELSKKSRKNSVKIEWSLSEINGKAGSSKEVEPSGVEKDTPAQEEIFLYYYQVKEEEHFDPSIKRIYVPYDAILSGFYQDNDRVVPVIPNVTEGWHDQNIRKNFDKIVAASSQKGIAVGNLGWIEPFVTAGVNVFGDYGLNLYNSMDFLLAGELGIKEAVIAHEADPDDILEMDFHGVVPEVVLRGKIPVMTSAYCIFAPSSAWPGKTDSSERTEKFQPAKAGEFPYGTYQTFAFANEVRCASESETEGRCPVGDLNFCGLKEEQAGYFLKDRKGQFYPILTNYADCRSVILSHKDTNLLMKKEELKKAGIYRFRIYAG
ncbi:MAG TPA: U32 family peptidase, partial [Anaerovoracaceae bacterium]|nr:U32 family peptidase [Anaerovoracaceae bacterium]